MRKLGTLYKIHLQNIHFLYTFGKIHLRLFVQIVTYMLLLEINHEILKSDWALLRLLDERPSRDPIRW